MTFFRNGDEKIFKQCNWNFIVKFECKHIHHIGIPFCWFLHIQGYRNFQRLHFNFKSITFEKLNEFNNFAITKISLSISPDILSTFVSFIEQFTAELQKLSIEILVREEFYFLLVISRGASRVFAAGVPFHIAAPAYISFV